MYECAKDNCTCMVEEQFTYCSDECIHGLACGCVGCDCGSETDS